MLESDICIFVHDVCLAYMIVLVMTFYFAVICVCTCWLYDIPFTYSVHN